MDIPIRIDPNYGVVQEVNTEDKEIVDIPGF
jgi:hypothetical protein